MDGGVASVLVLGVGETDDIKNDKERTVRDGYLVN
jgi:hypothetical protein